MKISTVAIATLAVVFLAGCTKAGTSNTSTINTSTTPATETSTPTSLPPLDELNTTTDGAPTIRMDEYSFSPTNLELKVGQAQQVTISNTGRIRHTYQVPDLDIDVTLAAGKSETITVTPKTAGTFEVTCTEPGHTGLGMEGTVTVK